VVVGVVVQSGGGAGIVGSVEALPAHVIPPPVIICSHVHCDGQSALVWHVVTFSSQCEVGRVVHVGAGGGTSPVPDVPAVPAVPVPELPLLLPLLPPTPLPVSPAGTGVGTPVPVPTLTVHSWSCTHVKPSPQSKSTVQGSAYFGTHC
jgi:hypothetical protein